jgi:hypothetical protein
MNTYLGEKYGVFRVFLFLLQFLKSGFYGVQEFLGLNGFN